MWNLANGRSPSKILDHFHWQKVESILIKWLNIWIFDFERVSWNYPLPAQLSSRFSTITDCFNDFQKQRNVITWSWILPPSHSFFFPSWRDRKISFIPFQVQGGYWFLGSVMCDVYSASDVACSTASILILTVISFDRLAIVKICFKNVKRLQQILSHKMSWPRY